MNDTDLLWWALGGMATVAAILYYPASCWLFPFTRCWVCRGTGRRTRKDGKVWRLCRWCGGTGRRLRVGRRLANWWRRRRDAARPASERA